MTDLANVRFDEATDEQFRDFWSEAGFALISGPKMRGATREAKYSGEISVRMFLGDSGYISIGTNGDMDFEFSEIMDTFGEALDHMNALAAVPLFGGWADAQT